MTNLLQSADKHPFPFAASVANPTMFFKRWLANPLQMGSIVPSSAALCQRVVRQARLDKDELVLELGAGTGVISQALLASGLAADRLCVVEIVSDMANHLRQALPGVTVVEGDARQLRDLIPVRWHGRIGTVVCGIPLVLLPKAEQRRFIDAMEAVAPGSRVSTLQLLRDLTTSRSASWPCGKTGSMDAAEFSSRKCLAVYTCRSATITDGPVNPTL